MQELLYLRLWWREMLSPVDYVQVILNVMTSKENLSLDFVLLPRRRSQQAMIAVHVSNHPPMTISFLMLFPSRLTLHFHSCDSFLNKIQ